MGYPNPDQIPLKEDATFRGICVYVPDQPEYLRALLGSLTGLGQWVNWERDANKSAARSAELWRMANDLTLSTWTDACGCDDMNCDDLREIIREELENMTISIVNTNNNCGCGCGCGCGNGPQTDAPPPPGVDYPPMPSIPPGEDLPPAESSSYAQYSCNMSHYMFFLIRSAVMQIFTSWNNNPLLSVAAFFPSRADAGQFVRPGGADYADWNYWEWFILRRNELDMIDLVRQMDASYDNLICALSGSYSAENRRTRFLNVVGAMPISENQRRWVRLAVSGIEFHSWFNPLDFGLVQEVIPESYANRACPCTASTSPPPDGYYLARAMGDEWDSTPNNASASASYNPDNGEFIHYSLNTSLNYHEVDVKILVEELAVRTGGQSAHGFVIEMITDSDPEGQIRLPTATGGTLDTVVAAGKTVILYQGDEYANVPTYAAYIDSFAAGSRFNYGNGAQTNTSKNGWRTQTYGNTLTSFRYRVRAICKL